MSEVNPECKAQISPPTKIIWTYLFFCTHTHQSVMNVKIEQKPLVDAAWVIITCCRSVNGGSTFSVCRSCNCNNKLLFRLECYQKKKKKMLTTCHKGHCSFDPSITLELIEHKCSQCSKNSGRCHCMRCVTRICRRVMWPYVLLQFNLWLTTYLCI